MRLLALVEARDHVCYRYRIQAFEAALAAAGVALVQEPLEAGAVGRWNQLRRAREFDAVILQRRLLPAWQLDVLRKSARRLIFDYDDAVLFRDSYSRKGPHSRKRVRRFARTVGAADLVIAGNRFLESCAEQCGAVPDRVRIIPTCIDLDLYPTVWDGLAPSVSPLVWIGSSSTLQGLENNGLVWKSLGTELPGLAMRVICDRFPKFDGLPVVPVPWARETEARELAAGGIGVGLLPHDEWSQGKCGLKVLQYQAAGLPVVANPWGAHLEMVRPGVDGFLPSNAREWVAAVRQLAEDDDLRRAMGAAGRRQLEARYSTRVWAEAFVDAVTSGRQRSIALTTSAGRSLSRTGTLASSTK
jgi:glycosyltransferase involved in cell wall biosynthesis